MNIEVQRAEYKDIEVMRDLYRQEANCQIICDSLLRRELADPYVILVEGRKAGYGGVRNRHDPGRLMEFYTLPYIRGSAQLLFRELLDVSQAIEMEAQTNMPLMVTMLYDFATDIAAESVLFQDAFITHLSCPNGVFRHSTADSATTFPQKDEPEGDWVVEANGAVVATGGFLCHYNPPYGDVYMEVAEPARRQGVGSYIVQEVKRVCYEAGKKPAARCNATNFASRKTLQKAGFLPCGRMLVGKIGTAA